MNKKISEDISLNRELFRLGMQDGIPIALGYFAVSFAFGMTAVASGIRASDAILISASNVTSAGQFAALATILASGSYLELILGQIVINLRYMLMSFSLSQRLESDIPLWKKLLMAFGVTDEIYGISIVREGYVRADFHLGAMLVAIPAWILGTIAGAILGNALPALLLSALSVALYGMFIAIVTPGAREDKGILGAVLTAMLLSGLGSWLIPISSGMRMILITILVSALFALLLPRPEEVEDDS